jgi:hypothetical protein
MIKWEAEEKQWFMKLIEAMVKKPDEANFARRKVFFDLELLLMVDPKDEEIFTDTVLDGLIEQVSIRTGALKPVIYLKDKPNAKAREQLNYAYHQI